MAVWDLGDSEFDASLRVDVSNYEAVRAEIRELLQLRQTDSACCNDVRQRAIEKRLQLAAKIRGMQSMSAALDRLIAECADGGQSVDDCPIMAALEQIDGGTEPAR